MDRWHCCAGREAKGAASAGTEEHEEEDDATLVEASMTTVAKTHGRGERDATSEAAREPERKVSERVIVGRMQRWLEESEAGS